MLIPGDFRPRTCMVSIQLTDDLSIGLFPVLVLFISIATIVSLQWMLGYTALGGRFVRPQMIKRSFV